MLALFLVLTCIICEGTGSERWREQFKDRERVDKPEHVPLQALARLMFAVSPSSWQHHRHIALASNRNPLPDMKLRMNNQDDPEKKRHRFRFWKNRKTSEEFKDELKGEGAFVDARITQFGKKLNDRLATSLESFQEEVLDEVDVQADRAKERQERLKERQSAIWDSLAELQQDIFDDIEEGLEGLRRGQETLDRASRRALREMQDAWKSEVDELIVGARKDVDTVVNELETSINLQRDEWQTNADLFEKQWLLPYEPSNSSSKSQAPISQKKFDAGLAELEATINAISKEVESDLGLFKQRWETTAHQLEELPSEITKLKSLVALRMYVANTIFAGDVPELLTQRAESYQRIFKDGALPKQKLGDSNGITPPDKPLKPDPLGLREARAETNAVLRPTDASNMRLPNRQILIVTTAALPWMTGTAINPTLRAAYLSKAGYNITLMVPWLDLKDQATLFPSNLTFERPALQEQYIRYWCDKKASVDAPNLRIRWYPAEYAEGVGCVFPLDDDLTSLIPESERDIAILEEPEHLTWYHHGPRWIDKFSHVVGVGHTNYLSYARQELTVGLVKAGPVKEKFLDMMNNMVCTAHTDLIIRLSATLPKMTDNDLVCNVHGVRAEFLAVGRSLKPWERDLGAYFLGKALYAKGYRELIDAMETHRAEKNSQNGTLALKGSNKLPALQTYGSGPDFEEIVEEIKERDLPIEANPGIDHAHPSIQRYRVFVNPSTSDVLCTATAEALAMGKRVIIPDHPSNTFFKQFANTMMYKDPREVVNLINEALEKPPAPLTNFETYMLSWEAASERLLDASALPYGTFNRRVSKGPKGAAAHLVHSGMSAPPVHDVVRAATGRPPKVPWKDRLEDMPITRRVINSVERMKELKIKSKSRKSVWRRTLDDAENEAQEKESEEPVM